MRSASVTYCIVEHEIHVSTSNSCQCSSGILFLEAGYSRHFDPKLNANNKSVNMCPSIRFMCRTAREPSLLLQRVPYVSCHRATTPQTTKSVQSASLKVDIHRIRCENIPALCATMHTACNEWFAAPCICGADGRRHSAMPVLHPAESSLYRAHINCRFNNTPFSVFWRLHCAWYLHKDALL